MSHVEGKVIKGRYVDSVFLMRVAKEIRSFKGVIDSAFVVGSLENLKLLKESSLEFDGLKEATGNDLVLAIKHSGDDREILKKALALLEVSKNESTDEKNNHAKNLDGALKKLPSANLAIISIAGKYAAEEALKALKSGLHVMLFSDNVTIEEELKLKTYGQEHGLLVMGPDCGTAILAGIPLAFANVVKRGSIGVVAASGTGLQEVTSVISNLGGGISEAIGTGGRDIKKEIGGITFLMGLDLLINDPKTEVIVLVSKPPHADVLKKIEEKLKETTKPVVKMFLGETKSTIAEAAAHAVSLALQKKDQPLLNEAELKIEADKVFPKIKKGKFVKGLYSGGTFCFETQLILNERGHKNIFSNAPCNGVTKLSNSFHFDQNAIVDLGEDEFTVGRPHPMIDFTLRNQKIEEEAKKAETAFLIIDLVLGYGANLEPMNEITPALQKALSHCPVIVSVTGTDGDPQNRKSVMRDLEKLGAIVKETNAEAALLASYLLKRLESL